MKSRTLVIIFSAIIILCAVIYLFISCGTGECNIAVIYKDGVPVEKIDLNAVTDEREIVLSDEHGENTVVVSHGDIRMKAADCKDQICVRHGSLAQSGTPIICLPHRIVIKSENASEHNIRAGGEK